jgi:5-methylcytosine-specific restriction protein A
MALSDLTASAVLKAIEEFDLLGRDSFLKKYGFGKARSYVLQKDGQSYDSKAIAGAAHGHPCAA